MARAKRKRIDRCHVGLLCGEELRTGALGVPLALAPDLHRMVLVNKEPINRSAMKLGLSRDVARRMVLLMKRHGIPSADRRIVLSLGYPERSHADIAAAFRTTVDHVNNCVLRMSSIRRAEPLSTELWEDITETTMSQDEVSRRAAEVRRLNELDEREVPDGTGSCAPRREGVGGLGSRQRRRCGAWKEDCLTKP